MPKGGHNRKSNKLKALEGGDRADRLNNPPVYIPVFPSEPPKHLPEYAKEFWCDVAPGLIRANLLTEADIKSFEVMALTYNTICQAEKCIDEEGLLIDGARGGQVKNPAISILNQARQQFRLQCQSFGLDPLSRERLNVPVQNGYDEMEYLLSGIEFKKDFPGV
jgi:P27 family predicted phage terminase small subunit